MRLDIFNKIVVELITESRITDEIINAEVFDSLKPELAEETEYYQVIRFLDDLDDTERFLLDDNFSEYVKSAYEELLEIGEIDDDIIEEFTDHMYNLEDVNAVFAERIYEYCAEYVTVVIEGSIMKYSIKK